MDFRDFSELCEFVRRYNSTSILEIGAEKCWQKWGINYSNALEWLHSNTERNYIVRLMLLASAGNPHRSGKISTQEFDSLINTYHNWDKHTISDQRILEDETQILQDSILRWEINRESIVRNWSLKLSSILDPSIIRSYVGGLFLQRLVAFQNAGFGKPVSRIQRTIKLTDLLDDRSKNEFSENFFKQGRLYPADYFKQFLVCLTLFGLCCKRKGFINLSQLPEIDDDLQKEGITSEKFKLFIKGNSIPFSTKVGTSFRSKVAKSLHDIPDYYQPLFYNHFLETPFVSLGGEKFCLPDPLSFTESCWNQIRGLISKDDYTKQLNQLLSRVFEDYLEKVLFPLICPTSFKRILEIKNPASNKDKRADFLIETTNSYIVVECKSAVMSSDTSAYFQANKLADLWCRIHSAFEQISMTVHALKLYDKPVIPLVLTFYDSIAASTIFEEIVKQTDYCSRMGLNIPPIVHSLHEFEHWISDRSLNNWSELILSKHSDDSSVKPDNSGHNYKHLDGISML